MTELETVDSEQLHAMARQLHVWSEQVQPVLLQYQKAIVRTGKAFLAVQRGLHRPLAPTIYGDEFRRHRRRCRICNPRGNPLPMKADGREYARRLKARRRRGRG